MNTFFLPLGDGSKWGNNELRYCLRSLEENWIPDFKVVIYGDPDCKPNWLKNVVYKEVERFYPEELIDEKLEEINPKNQEARIFNTNVDKLNALLFASPIYAVKGVKK